MPMLADTVDGVIGVDTHRDTLTAAAVTTIGGQLAHATATTDTSGYRDLLAFATTHLPNRRCWAIEGAGSFGAGLATFLLHTANTSWRCPADDARPGAPRPRATRWTPSTSPATRSSSSIPRRCVGVATAKRCGCC